jgi:hypothetical protein
MSSMNTIIEYLKANKLAAIGAILALVLIVSRKARRMIFGSPVRRRRRTRPVKVKTVVRGNRSRVVRRNTTRSGRPLPRSAGRSRGSSKGYPAAGGGTIPFKYNKDGSIKKAQFVAGTLAAKRRMAALRKNR